MLQKFWHDLPFRTQILVALGLINLCALLLASALAIANARNATRIEIEASVEIAKQFVRATLQGLEPAGRVENASKNIGELSRRLQLGNLRHVRIFMADATGNLVQISPKDSESRDPTKPKPAPRWFTALVEPSVAPHKLSVVLADPVGNAVLIVEHPVNAIPKIWEVGSVVVIGETADEIAEIWQDVSSVAVVWVTLDALVLAVLYLVLGRMLDPLASLVRGMRKLESGHYNARIESPRVKEFAAIAAGFNQLAGALDKSRDENARLYGQLISVQEDERREIANELHDEASPCLFGIMANTLSIRRLHSERRSRASKEVLAHVSEILKITDHLNLMNRALLKKLRPVALGRAALTDVVSDLVSELQRRHPDVRLLLLTDLDADSYGEVIDLTIYRSVQEGVTNAIRHGKAVTVQIELFDKPASGGALDAAGSLQLKIQDDGHGVSPGPAVGFGTTVMRERVHALGGTFLLGRTAPRGTSLRIVIPINGVAGKISLPMELVQAS